MEIKKFKGKISHGKLYDKNSSLFIVINADVRNLLNLKKGQEVTINGVLEVVDNGQGSS